MEREWEHAYFDDGTEQVWRAGLRGKVAPLYIIERVVRPNSRRKRWVVVDRNHKTGDRMYPPKVAGPFKDLDAAKVALLMLLATLT